MALRDLIREREAKKWRAAYAKVLPEFQATPSRPRAKYRDDPRGYARDIFGVELWERQGQVADSVAKHPRTGTRSGHKVGKSTLAAILAWWWVDTREHGQTIMTSSGFKQVKHILWKELRRLWSLAQKRGHDIGPEPPLDPETGVIFADGVRAIYGFTTAAAEKMAGFSGHELFFIVDEGSGFPDPIFEAVESNLAGGGKILALGNPTQTSGWFFELFRKLRHLWATHHISGEESPNVVQDREVVAGLMTRDHVRMMQAKYGPDHERHPVYMVRVMGIPPEQGTDAVIGLGAISAAQARRETATPDGPLEVGVDVARFGDDETIITGVRGHYQLPSVAVFKADGPTVAAAVASYIRAHEPHPTQRVPVKVDGIGVGSSVVDHLRGAEYRDLVIVHDVNVGTAATDPDYTNLRSQLWFAIGQWLAEGGALVEDAELEQELLAPTFKTDKLGRMQVESKDDIKRKIKRSPDRADALALAVYHIAASSGEIRTVANATRRAVRSLKSAY